MRNKWTSILTVIYESYSDEFSYVTLETKRTRFSIHFQIHLGSMDNIIIEDIYQMSITASVN